MWIQTSNIRDACASQVVRTLLNCEGTSALLGQLESPIEFLIILTPSSPQRGYKGVHELFNLLVHANFTVLLM
jgi:hypothetical protein